MSILILSQNPVYAVSCYNIQNKDKRNYCLATRHLRKNPQDLSGLKGRFKRCYQIQNRDSRNYCLAISKKNKTYCYFLHDLDEKKLCLLNF